VRALVPDFALNHLRLGRVYERLGEERAALDSYRTALKKDPADLRPFIALGDFYLARGQRPQAQNYYETALKLLPEYIDAKIGLGRLLMAKQDWQRARILLESIETENLDGTEKTDYDRSLHYLLALIASELRDYDAAVKNYDRLLRYPEDVFFLTHSRRDLERRRAIANDLARTTRGE
jgi:cytochrome c-type biogenesis protein CcmH/NrfG